MVRFLDPVRDLMTRLIKFFSTYESLDDALAGKAHDPS